jgi:hypothetical protein
MVVLRRYVAETEYRGRRRGWPYCLREIKLPVLSALCGPQRPAHLGFSHDRLRQQCFPGAGRTLRKVDGVEGLGGGVSPPLTPTLRRLDLVALTRRVPMRLVNTHHRCQSSEEHECEDDGSLHH